MLNQEHAVKVSESRYCHVCKHVTRVGLDPSHPIQLLEIYAVFAATVLTISSGLEPRDGTFRTCLSTRYCAAKMVQSSDRRISIGFVRSDQREGSL